MTKEECIKIGFVAKLHGYKGEVSIIIDDDFEDVLVLENIKSIFIENNDQLIPYFVEKVGGTTSMMVVLLEDVNNETEAKKLVKKSVYLLKNTIPKRKTPKDDISLLIGYLVVDKVHGDLGAVLDILEFPQQLLLQLKYKSKEVLIPLVEPLIIKINKRNKTISVDLPEGFLDI